MAFVSFRRLLIGDPLATQNLENERLNKRRGLAVLSSDALSSTAYATEEMLKVLVLVGAAGFSLTLPITFAIGTLLAIVGFSYHKIIHAYPQGGGAYLVGRENLGTMAGLIAAAALLVDYTLTVAVSACAAVAQLRSAFPSLIGHEVDIALIMVAIVTILNLRGVKESGTTFAIPTYAFIIIYGSMILYGLVKIGLGDIPRQPLPPIEPPPGGYWTLGAFIIFKAFSSGAAALTGIEAVSNGVSAFRPPQAKNASKVLFLMLGLLLLFFIGTSFLASWLGIAPHEHETVVSQVGRYLFGTSFLYYAVQISTILILFLAANTAYTGFPRLACLLAQDRFLPRQLANLGDRLVFSNGILILGLIVGMLVILFQADEHRLIPLYMVGVFITFTIAQTGMIRYWLREGSKHRYFGMSLNGVGAICTTVVGTVVLAVKFTDGAWITFIAIPCLVVLMYSINRHYEEFKVQISLDYAKAPKPFSSHKVVMPVSDIHRGVLEAVRYARTLSDDVSALYVDLGNHERMEGLKREWEKWVPDVPMVILPSPYRSVIKPIVHHLDHLRDSTSTDTAITVVIPEFVPVKWWHHLLHNQTAFFLKFALLFRRRQNRRYKVLADVPYYLRR